MSELWKASLSVQRGLFLSSWRGWFGRPCSNEGRFPLPGRVGVLAMALLFSWEVHGASKSAADYARDLESTERNAKREAAYQLSRMGREARVALPQLIKALEDDQQQVWFGAVTALANLGPEAEPALPALLRELESWEPSRRDRQGAQALYRTAAALGAIGRPSVPALSNGLSSTKWQVRAGSVMALGFVRPAATETLPAVTRLLGDPRAEVRDAAVETVVGFGVPAVDLLIPMVREDKSAVTRRTAVDTLGRMGAAASTATEVLRAAIGGDTEEAVRAASVSALARIEGRGTNVVPVLLETWRDGPASVSLAAKRELLLVQPVGHRVVPFLLAELESGDIQRQRRAADLLREFGPDASPAVPLLVGMLRQTESSKEPDAVIVAALAATGDAGLRAALDEAGRFPEASNRAHHWTREVLRRLDGTTAPALGAALTHPVPAVRALALESLTALGTAARGESRRILPLLKDPAPMVRARAWIAAPSCGVAAEPLLAQFDQALKDSEFEVRQAALEGVARLGRGARPAVPKLEALLTGPDERLQVAAVKALGGLGLEAAPAADSLAQRLPDASPELQVELLSALGSMGTAAAPVVSKLGPMAESQRPEVRRALMETAARLGEGGREALAWVTNGVRDAHPGVRASSLRAWAALDGMSDAAAEAVASGMEDPESEVRRGALEAAIKLGERARLTEPRLFALLRAGSERELVLEAIRAIHPVSVPDLQAILTDEDWKVRQMAADALARLGKMAEGALSDLERLQREDPSEDVKRACRRAVRRIREG
ncbi:MAG: HEAT repeat domain-containing protein [Verrucomicrobiales bacterium]|nr:HEAT repeat domain-containing protein [Verrucomicrobiales bacterium]